MDDEEIQQFIVEHLQFIEKKLGEEMALFYKVGFIDGVHMIKELSEIQREKNHLKEVAQVNRAIRYDAAVSSEKIN